MAAEEFVVLVKEPDGRYVEVGRPIVEQGFEALESVSSEKRGPEMYTIPAVQVETWILIPQGDRPTSAALVKVLPDGTLVRVRDEPAA